MPPLRIPSVSGTWNNQQIRIRPDRLVVSVRPGVRNPESILAGIPHLIETHAHTPAIAVYTPGRRWAVFKFAPLSASQILDLAGLIKASDQRIRYVCLLYTSPSPRDR